jgi:hypothetical protein
VGTCFAKKDMLEQEDRAGCRFEENSHPALVGPAFYKLPVMMRPGSWHSPAGDSGLAIPTSTI